MNISYDPVPWKIEDIIKNASNDATILIPDLQRPYVWTPSQVILLMDSIFRGWPFGSLLVWEVGDGMYSDNEGIPYRKFWQVVDRTASNGGPQVSMKQLPTSYYMILDGQQRIQSLLLALGGDDWGFKLYDHDWANDNDDGKRMRKGIHWSKAVLYFDCELFLKEIECHDSKATSIEIKNILKWAVNSKQYDLNTVKKPANYIPPLAYYEEKKNGMIRFRRLWDIALKDKPESYYRGLLEEMDEWKIFEQSMRTKLIQPLSEFMQIIATVKFKTVIQTLQIARFDDRQCSIDDYNEAIVNIFTRLNTAGRVLTREEITLAWLKIGWDVSKTEGKQAGHCIEALREELRSIKNSLTTDEVVRLISYLWSSLHRLDGKRLEDRDLLKGDVVKPMAEQLSSDWLSISDCANHVVRILEQRQLQEMVGSFNAIAVATALYYPFNATYLEIEKRLNVAEKHNLRSETDTVFGQFLDRWILSTEWAGTWGDISHFQEFASFLWSIREDYLTCTDTTSLVAKLEKSCNNLLNQVTNQSIQSIEVINEKATNRVYRYHSLLWVWHRLSKDRWEYSKIPIQETKKKTTKLEVDHTVSSSYWENGINSLDDNMIDNTLKELSKQGITFDAADYIGFREQIITSINSIGNCSLLKKSFNISKSANTMHSFLIQINEFQDSIYLAAWCQSLLLGKVLIEPDTATVVDVLVSIGIRENGIKEELKRFVRGELTRQDI